MADPARARRLAKRIMAIVAAQLSHQIKDPRLAMVTVTAATVTPDLRDATIFYTVYGDDADRAASAAALASATGVVRSAVGRETGIKFTPTITFVVDTVGEQSRHIEELLAKAKASDEAIAARSVGAGFAGEADPYKQPRIDDDEAEEA
jgi:ribosome-binding factor A